MNTEALELLIEEMRKANSVLTAQNEALTARLAALEAANAPEAQGAEPQAESTATASADAALELLRQKTAAAQERDREFVENMRARGMSCGTSEDYRKYRESRG